MSEFYILTKGGPLPDDVYNNYMKNYEIKEITFERVSDEKKEKEFPGYFIGYNQECLDVFLDVLKYENDLITSEVISLFDQL